MKEAANGEPTALLTLTVNIQTGSSAGERRDLLHAAWKSLVKRINRQFQLPPQRRWQLETKARSAKQQAWLLRTTSKSPQGCIKTLPYLAFLERTKRGEPHLHILIRAPYIPQDWLSEQMTDLLGSPVVWIEAIKGSKHAIAYVTKYVTKAPAQWGNKKRYWQSRNWNLHKDDEDTRDWKKHDDVEVVRIQWSDLAQRRSGEGWTAEIDDQGWWKWWRPGQHPRWTELIPWIPHRARPPDEPPPHPPTSAGSESAGPKPCPTAEPVCAP